MKPIRVLHVAWCLEVGGIETWIRNVFTCVDRQHVAMDVLVLEQRSKSFLVADIERAGGRVFVHREPDPETCLAPEIEQLMVSGGPYDVVHLHLTLRWFPLFWAERAGVPVRILHFHNPVVTKHVAAKPLQALFHSKGSDPSGHFATRVVSVSESVARARFGDAWRDRCSVLRCGINCRSFERRPDRHSSRRSLGISDEALTLAHVGRIDAVKNHRFLVETFEALKQRRPAHLLLVGDGPNRSELEELISSKRLSEHVTFLGTRPDVPALLQDVADYFALPSHSEGLPLVVLEAQAAGVPCAVSTAVTEEVDAAPGLVMRLPLERGPEQWAMAIVQHSSAPRLSPEKCLSLVRAKGFDVADNARNLVEIYERELEEHSLGRSSSS